MEIFKVIGIGIIGAIIAVLLKNSKPEFSLVAVLATGVVILIILLSSLKQVIQTFSLLVEKSGLSTELFATVLKIIGIGYLTEYSSSVVSEYSGDALAKKIQLAGKLTIFIMALPIITSLLDLIGGLMQ